MSINEEDKFQVPAPLPRPLEQEQWTVNQIGIGNVYEVKFGKCTFQISRREKIHYELIADAHNTSLRALQEELVAAHKALDAGGVATGNEHGSYGLVERIDWLVKAKELGWRRADELKQRIKDLEGKEA